VVFGKPIGANQGVQFPLARSYAMSSAACMRDVAAEKFDRGENAAPKPIWRSFCPAKPRGIGEPPARRVWRLRLCPGI